MSKPLLAIASLLAVALPAQAAISIGASSPTAYTQSFDSLTTTSTTSTSWSNDSTLTGWSLFLANGTVVNSYIGGTGSSSTGSFYSFGSGSGATERALGGVGSGGTYYGSPAVASGAVAGYIAVAFANTSATAFDSFTLSFDGEQWRNGNTTAQTMALEYGFGSSFGSVAGWTAAGASFNFTSPVVGSTGAAVNGNSAGLVSGLGGTVAVNWNTTDTLWLRWVENNDVGSDHGLAIDNLSLGVTAAIPEPGTYALLLAGLAAVGFVARRRA